VHFRVHLFVFFWIKALKGIELDRESPYTSIRNRSIVSPSKKGSEVKMSVPDVIISQYLASLEMLKRAVTKCPESLWNDPNDKNPFWHVAYHAIFYTHLYLQESEQTFTPWSKHRNEYQFLGQVPWPPHAPPQIGEPYDKVNLLEYLALCQNQVRERVPWLDLEAASGFDWLPFGKLELQFYNLRHLQQHTGELMERLGSRANTDIDWVGTMHA
jgi:hypothetical protein